VTGQAFMRYMASKMSDLYVDGCDPCVEFYDDKVRVTDLRGESAVLPPNPRQLRAVAQQLQMIADEIERRGFE
jgi:hypothetical protein